MKCKQTGKTMFLEAWRANAFIAGRAPVQLRKYVCEFCNTFHVTKQDQHTVPTQLTYADRFKQYMQ